MQKLVDELNNFVVEDEDQERDVDSFKQAIGAFGENLFYRENLPAHVCSAVWVTNPERTKSLLGYHNIYESLTWFGGHADGEFDILSNAKKELTEETGISNYKILNNGKPIDFLTSCILCHIKRGKKVPDHLHYCVVYLFEVSENEKFRIKEDENSEIRWVNNEEVMSLIKEKESVRILFKRLLKNIKSY